MSLSSRCGFYRKPAADAESLPIRAWTILVFMVNDHGEQVPAAMFDKVTYHLHPSFGDRTIQSMCCQHSSMVM